MRCKLLSQPLRNGEVLTRSRFSGRDLRCRPLGGRLLLAVVLALTSTGVVAQSETACGAAVTQLQGYVQQVNTIAQWSIHEVFRHAADTTPIVRSRCSNN